MQNPTGAWDYLDCLTGFVFGEAVQRVEFWVLQPGSVGAAKAQNILAMVHLWNVSRTFVANNYDGFNKRKGLMQFPYRINFHHKRN